MQLRLSLFFSSKASNINIISVTVKLADFDNRKVCKFKLKTPVQCVMTKREKIAQLLTLHFMTERTSS